jgi:hypothetical protein
MDGIAKAEQARLKAEAEAEKTRLAESEEKVKAAKLAFDIMISAASAAAIKSAEDAAKAAEYTAKLKAEAEAKSAAAAGAKSAAEVAEAKAKAEAEAEAAKSVAEAKAKANAEAEAAKSAAEVAEAKAKVEAEAAKSAAAFAKSAAEVAEAKAKAEAEIIKTENITRSIATSAAIAAAMVAIENAKKPVATIAPIQPAVPTENISKQFDDNDRIMAIASAVMANNSADALVSTNVNTALTDQGIVTPHVAAPAAAAASESIVTASTYIATPPASTDIPTPPEDPTRTKRINGLLVLIAHILKQPGTQITSTELPIIPFDEPSTAKPAAKPPIQVDTVKYNKTVKDFKTAIIKKYPLVTDKSISISPVAIEQDAPNDDKYILFASFDVNGVKKTQYNN